ncbi:phage holin family protein [Streptomyces sp. NPDC000229]|uniref:phage holin family protein n=1 Tax=Streptomyces sp. NPDC000229 TaxID=3154247 RepID=UPI003326FEFC
MSTVEPSTGSSGRDDSVGALVTQASQLVPDEMRLAQAEMVQKGKRFGIGGGLFGGAGMVAFLALQALVATGIAALALVLTVWASALIVCGALVVIAAVLALTAKKQVAQATPPTPERAIDSVKADVAEIKEKAHR